MHRQQQDLPTDPNSMAETEEAERTQQLTHRSAGHPSLLAEPAAKPHPSPGCSHILSSGEDT